MIINKNKTVGGLRLWDNSFSSVPELKPLCRQIAAEGSVLLINDGVLPLKRGTRVALFGRNQEGYIKSGTGSGGLVRVEKTPIIWDSFKENGIFSIDEELVDIYKDWIKDNPYDNGHGWATEPWVQKEMPVDSALASRFAKKNDVAVIIFGRTAGEDRDNNDEAGSYKPSIEELELIRNVSNAFNSTVVILNVGNMIDLSFVDDNNISALLYCWQGGEEGANALADILSGKISPSGKLPDTQVYDIADYPSLSDFGNKEALIYNEDIYVGYRYFETFMPDRVRFPFGFGLTYTDFDITYSAKETDNIITVEAKIKNIGNFPAKQVLEVYYGAPCGKLGTPVKQLIDFAKTKTLAAGEEETVSVSFGINQMAAYDDCGKTGFAHSYVLESGNYKIFAGTDVKNSSEVLDIYIEKTTQTEKLEQIMPPEVPFERIIATEDDGKRIPALEAAVLRSHDHDERIVARRDSDIPYTGNKGIKLIDVADGNNTLDELVAQLTDRDLAAIVCGEGMDSPKVTPGTGAAFGGVTDALLDLGIPVCCVTDGPSGLRLGNDYKSTSLPNGYIFAASFDTELTERIFELEGVELFRYNIDGLLGPGMNIHRHPLCGRNFEYFSEDPVLSGKIAAAESRCIAKSGCTTTIKHFCGNNQEQGRSSVNDIVSERALREIYLKGYEIAVKEGHSTAIMTSYGQVNGYYTASNYDLCTTVLRKEWGYDGIVMTDWWAKANTHGEAGNDYNLKAMLRAQNDIYMVCPSAADKYHNILDGLKDGFIVRSDLQRSAKNLLRYIMHSPAFEKFVEGGCVRPDFGKINDSEMETVAEFENINSGDSFEVSFGGDNVFIFEVSSSAEALAQSTLVLEIDWHPSISFSIEGTEGNTVIVMRKFRTGEKEHRLSLSFPPAIKLHKLIIKK